MFAVGWSRSCPAAVHSAVGHSRRQATRRLASSRPRRHFPRSAGCALACSQMRRSFMCAEHRMVLSPYHAWELPLSAGVPCRDIMARLCPFWHRLGLPRASFCCQATTFTWGSISCSAVAGDPPHILLLPSCFQSVPRAPPFSAMRSRIAQLMTRRDFCSAWRALTIHPNPEVAGSTIYCPSILVRYWLCVCALPSSRPHRSGCAAAQLQLSRSLMSHVTSHVLTARPALVRPVLRQVPMYVALCLCLLGRVW